MCVSLSVCVLVIINKMGIWCSMVLTFLYTIRPTKCQLLLRHRIFPL